MTRTIQTSAEQILVQQPEALRQTAQEIARVLRHPVYSATISIPYNDTFIRVHAGHVLYQFFRKPCRFILIQKLRQLSTSSQPAVRQSVELACYLAAQVILSDLPDESALQENYTGFDAQGKLTTDLKKASAVVEDLSQFIHLLQLVEQLWPQTDDRYSEKYSLLVTHLLEQGRALANYQTQQITQDILTSWKNNEIIRGLTIFLPYLDERLYTMEEYKIVVIPTGRILFRPQFVIGACRVSERHVRNDPDLSQSTRWQLLSQLDTIIQAFEIESQVLTAEQQ